MRILVFNWRDITHPQAGGAELYLHEISKRLVKMGHTVDFFAGAYTNCQKNEIIDGINIIRRGSMFAVYISAVKNYLFNLRKNNYDIIIDDINAVPFFTPLFIRKPKIAIVHHIVGKDIIFKELKFPASLIAYVSERSIPLIYSGIRFVTVSDSSRRELVEFGIPDEKINIIYNGISDMGPILTKKTSFPSISYVGRLMRYKRLDKLIRAFAIVLEKYPSARLDIGGSGPDEQWLKSIVASLGLKSSITFHGFVQERMKSHLLSRSWIFVTPSQKEGWGVSVIEANKCGTPAIGFDVPGLRDSIRNGVSGILIKDDSEAELAKAIISIWSDKKRLKRMSDGAIDWANRFSWDKSASQVEKLLKDVMR